MLGRMMQQPLLISALIEHAGRYHGGTEVVSVATTGGIERATWADVAANARRLGSALTQMGLHQGDRCATIAWNNRRHLEIYFGVAGAGFVCHTINPRLAPEQLIYVINHAEDQVSVHRPHLFADRRQARRASENPARRGADGAA